MKRIPFLNWLERWALWVLVRSRNTGMVAVKQMNGPLLFIANAPFDEMPMNGSSPMANQLERIYRSSSSGTSQGPD
jgi:hypothetical protein